MNKEIVFTVDQNTPGMLGESFVIPHCCSCVSVEADVDPVFALMTYIVLLDPSGNVRLHKLLGHGEHTLVIGPDGLSTSPGGVPGKIPEGLWEIRIYIFTEYLAQFAPGQSFQVKLTAAWGDGAGAVPAMKKVRETVGENVWFKAGENTADRIFPAKPVGNSDTSVAAASDGRWYKGDFHTHTHLSDGKETVENAMKKAKDMQMDFYVPTEHNVIHTGWPKTDLLIIPGVEITTEKGHMNLFGIDRRPEKLLDILENMGTDRAWPLVRDCLKEAKQKEWIASINHPFLHIWKWFHMDAELADFDCMEIINDPTYTYAGESNNTAMEFLDMLWQDGYKIFGIGGSDSHNLIEERYEGATEPSIAGDPGTFVYARCLSEKEILAGVKAGHTYVSRYCRLEPEIECGGKKHLPGDALVLEDAVNYRLNIYGLDQMPEVFLVHNGKKTLLKCRTVPGGADTNVYEVSHTVRPKGQPWEWMRMEVRKKNGDFLAWVNPVYRGEKYPSYRTFGEALQKFGEESI